MNKRIYRYPPHVFRHCYATHHLERGTNLVFLKEQLGHIVTSIFHAVIVNVHNARGSNDCNGKIDCPIGCCGYLIATSLLKKELNKIRWVANHGRPTAETKVIEEYLGRYICRIGISNKRLSYDKAGKNVRIEYNDYRHQKAGELYQLTACI